MADDVEVQFGASIAGLIAGVAEVKEQIEGLAEFTKGVQATFSELGEALAAVFAGEQLAEFIEKISDLGSKVETASAQLGLAADKIQGIDYAARISDIGIDQATRTIQKFYQSVQQAQDPTTRQAAAFNAMGISVQKYLADGGTLEGLLETTTAKLGEYADGANKSTIETDLFGMKGAETARFINSLSEGIDKFTAVQQALHAPSEDTLQQLQEMHVRVVDLETAFENLEQNMAPLGLAAVRAAEGFVEFLSIVQATFTGLGILLANGLTEVQDFGNGVVAIFKALDDASFAELRQAASTTFQKMHDDAALAGSAVDDLVKQEKSLIAELENPAMKGVGTNKNGPQAPNPPPPHSGSDDYVQQWQGQLDKMLIAQQLFGDEAKAKELQFWQEKLADAKQGGTQYQSAYNDILQKVYALEGEARTRDIQNAKEALDQQLADAGNNIKLKEAAWQSYFNWLKQHYADDTKDQATAQAKMTELTNQQIQQSQKKFEQFFSSITSGFNSAIMGMIKGTETFQQAMASIFQDILSSILGVLEKWAAQQLATMIFGKTTAEATAASDIAASAAQAGAAAFASTAAIPIVGPELAPAAGAAAYAGAMAYESMASFDVGSWSVPRDMPAMVHEGETILPKTFAESFRENGGSLGGGGGDTHLHLYGNVIDGRSVKDFFYNNAGHITGAIKKAHRNGGTLGMG